MYFKRPLLTTHLYFLLLNVIFLALYRSTALSELPNDIAVNCGSSGNLNRNHGRKWVGDIGSELIVTSQGSKAKSISSKLAHLSDSFPYTTARISYKQFSYGFEVSSGQKFIRLNFYTTAYTGFKNSNDFFTVKAGPYTLLRNFSASLTTNALGVKYFTKEFCVIVEENQLLTITFSPSTGGTNGEAYAFVNGIEIISMPSGLYYTPKGEPGVHVVGKRYQLSIDESVALEVVYRLNMGGNSISSSEDTGLSRVWVSDSTYFVNSGGQEFSTTLRIIYRIIPTYTAPQKVYQTSWTMVITEKSKKDYNFTWKLPVDVGFRYIIRFHFCELEYEIDESSRLRFNIMINEQMAEANVDLLKWSGGSGVAVFRDYVAMMEGDRMEGKRDLIISLCPMWSNHDHWWTENTDTILRGLEVFKLSNPNNNLAGVNPILITQALHSGRPNSWKFVYANGGNFIATIIVILISFVSTILYQLRILGEQNGENNRPSLTSEGLCRHFSLAEVRSATNNFDDQLVIGKGGFGLVYKGLIDGGTISVAMKRLNSMSKQGAKEFWTEIEMLSTLRHTHLVSLIGYCNEDSEMILVYEYMEHGTLADHLYKISSGGSSFNLSWEQKLSICIGGARGLDYLHTGTRHGVIHRDVKTTNILLDNEWGAKISDFGLCKVGSTSTSRTHVSTDVKGTFGYLDPEYFLTRRLTKKSDVYAFGVVLFEVLCGRPAVDVSLEEDQRSLALWAQYCIKEGKLDELVDASLQDKISSPCLKIFTEVACKCLHNRPHGRPTMADVVASLEGALISQNHIDELASEQNVEEDSSDDERDGHMFDTVHLGVAHQQNLILSPTTLEQDSENMRQKKKRSKGNLSKAFQWSLGIFNKRKNFDFWDYRYRRFTLAEIESATASFNHNQKLDGDGFGSVYKGWIDDGTIEVAIKVVRSSNADSFFSCTAEILAESQNHHLNIISLLGYWADGSYVILVYNYMVNKSLDVHLYGEGSGHSPLLWEKRLGICIGAAKGLQYVHSGTTQRILHRNIKPSNILLDESWVAKISDFEMSKVAMPDDSDESWVAKISDLDESWVSTQLCIPNRYLDLDYFCNLKMTEKTDVYAFGVVLLEVVCARKPYDFSTDKDQRLLVSWFRTCIEQRQFDQLIDPYLIGRISPDCLMKYLKVAWDCLLERGTERPTMNTVVESLQIAEQLQQTWNRDAEIDPSPEELIPSVAGRAYNNVLEYQYASSSQSLVVHTSANPSVSTDFDFHSDIGLTMSQVYQIITNFT